MIKVGIVDVHTSHPATFTSYLHKGDRARVMAVCDDGLVKKRRDGFIKEFEVKNIYSTPEDMVDEIDIAFIQSCNWDEHIKKALPFIKAGKPVYIDKPTVGNLKDCQELEKLAEDRAVILGGSSLRYCQEVEEFRKKPADEVGRILSVFTNIGVDEFNYGIHAMEMVQGLLGTGAEAVSFIASSEEIAQYLVEYKDGKLVIYQTQQGIWQPFTMTIITTKNTFQIKVDNAKIYGALLDRICDFMEKGSALSPVAELTETVKIYLAGKVSKKKNSKIKLADLDINDSGFDGFAFSQEYAKSVNSIAQ